MSGTFERSHVGGDLAWGKLVMSWTTQKDFVNGNGTAAYTFPPPGATGLIVNQGTTQLNTNQYLISRQDFETAVTGSGARIDLPAGVQQVIFVRDDKDTRYVRLPDADMVLAARALLNTGGVYSLPQFYSQAPLNVNVGTLTPQQQLVLQAERIGDYSIGSCM